MIFIQYMKARIKGLGSNTRRSLLRHVAFSKSSPFSLLLVTHCQHVWKPCDNQSGSHSRILGCDQSDYNHKFTRNILQTWIKLKRCPWYRQIDSLVARTVNNLGSISGSGRSPGEGNPLQYSCLENSVDRGAWQATQSMVSQSRARLSLTHYGRGR